MKKHLEKKCVKSNSFAKKLIPLTMASVVSVSSLLMAGCGNSGQNEAVNDNNLSQSVKEVVADNKDNVKETSESDTSVKESDSTFDENESENERESTSQEQEQTSEANKKHQLPPVIYGVEDKTYYVGEKASYMSDVYALDDTEGEVDVEVDKSQVDTSTAGSYTVYYKAVDSDGNETTEEAVFSFVEEETQTEAQGYSNLDELVSAVLDNITDSSMSMGEKARAVFNYAHGKIGYSVSNYDGYDWESEAYLALKDIEKRGYVGGDCFTYCSVDLALLQGIGADCIWVDNSGARSGDHSWLLCNVGSGWYHFDATRMYDKFECFMLTDAQIQAYIDKGNSIYWRDLSAYPATPDEPFSY